MALPNAVASRDASVLEASLVEHRRTGQAKALSFEVAVRYLTVVAEPVRFVKVRGCLMKGLQADWPELVVDCLDEDLFEALRGSWKCLAEPRYCR